MKRFALIGLVLFLISCSSASVSTDLTLTLAPLILESDETTLSVTTPPQWTGILDSKHIILTQSSAPLNSDGTLNGVIINIWLPDKTEIVGDVVATKTSDLLQQITNRPSYVGTATTTDPQAFVWQDYDGAYYALNNGDGNVTLVLALSMPDSRQLIAFNLSTNADTSKLLLPTFAQALPHIRINDISLTSSLVESLPPSVEFPTFKPPTSAMEASPPP
jgi:hypothetical protein